VKNLYFCSAFKVEKEINKTYNQQNNYCYEKEITTYASALPGIGLGRNE